MASTSHNTSTAADTMEDTRATTAGNQPSGVEMNDLQSLPQMQSEPLSMPGLTSPSTSSPEQATATSQAQEETAPIPSLPIATTSTSADPADAVTAAPALSPPAARANLTRTETEAIGPATDDPIHTTDPAAHGPHVLINLLLTTGARHPYKIDEKYLKKRNVDVEDMNAFNISVYQLKDLIWRDWRPEWETRPTSPTSIRLIHFGRMLDDKQILKDCRFQEASANVVHMTVKPQEVVDDEEAHKGAHGRGRDGEERTVGCRCTVM